MKIIIQSIKTTSILAVLIFLCACNQEENLEVSKQQQKAITPSVDLHTAIVSNNLEAVKQHIAAGSDLNIKDPFGGSSPILTAALFDKKQILSQLLNAGAELNFQNNDGSTALHIAAFFCRTDIVEFLLKEGIDKTIKNNLGSSAYDSVAGSFEEVKPFYDMIGQSLAPMGLVLDYEQIKKNRPIIAEILK